MSQNHKGIGLTSLLFHSSWPLPKTHEYNYTKAEMDEIGPRYSKKPPSHDKYGYEELPHTADWALKVWAPDISGLLEEAARGMYALMSAQRAPSFPTGYSQSRYIRLVAEDGESLLVGFLGELLFFLEEERLVFDSMRVKVQDHSLEAWLEGGSAVGQTKEIKAVTYHNLAIERVDDLLTATVVFDV